jgi:hypothetical protein
LLLAVAVWVTALLGVAAAWGGGSASAGTPGGEPRTATAHVRRELINFPYTGRGDEGYSFHHPYRPAEDGSGVSGWRQLGSAIVTGSDLGRDVVRLTNAGQGLQGVLYTTQKTWSMDFNGYFDILIGTAPGSAEPADGLGLFFTESEPEKGSAMGITEKFRGLGIVVDTFSNSRKRNTPHLFGFVSQGDRKWNPDTDGSDIELTAGCKLSMDTPTRIMVQLVDLNLHVAVSTNHRHDKWHTCFRYNNVPMPFTGGGYIAFGAETGHFFSYHDVLNAGIIVGDIHEDPGVRQRWRERQEREEHEREQLESQQRLEDRRAQDRLAAEHAAEGRRKDGTASSVSKDRDLAAAAAAAPPADVVISETDNALGDHLDEQIENLYAEFMGALKEKTTAAWDAMSKEDKASAESVRLSLKALGTMHAHMIQEVNRQTAETSDAGKALETLKRGAGELNIYVKRFRTEIAQLHTSTRELRQAQGRLREEHVETQDVIIAHKAMMGSVMHFFSEARPHGMFSTLIFIVLQAMLLAGFAVVYKMGPQRRKTNHAF